MNVRNLFLMSMIVCTAPVICTVPEVTLTQQEQAIIKKWLQEINIKKQHHVTQELFKFSMSSAKDFLSVVLGKMSIGKSKLTFNHELNHEKIIFEVKSRDEFTRRANQLIKKFRLNEQQTKVINEQLSRLSNVIENLLNKIITDNDRAMCFAGSDITEANIAIAKKVIAIYSFIVECL